MENTVREGFPEKVTPEQRLEWREPATCPSTEREFQAEGQVGAMAQRSGLLGMLRSTGPAGGGSRPQTQRPVLLHPLPEAQLSLS